MFEETVLPLAVIYCFDLYFLLSADTRKRKRSDGKWLNWFQIDCENYSRKYKKFTVRLFIKASEIRKQLFVNIYKFAKSARMFLPFARATEYFLMFLTRWKSLNEKEPFESGSFINIRSSAINLRLRRMQSTLHAIKHCLCNLRDR